MCVCGVCVCVVGGGVCVCVCGVCGWGCVCVASLVAHLVKNLPAMRQTLVRSLCQEYIYIYNVFLLYIDIYMPEKYIFL